MPDNSIELHRPSLNELSLRELMLGDEETMSYNNAWGGTVPFPMSRVHCLLNSEVGTCFSFQLFQEPS